MDQTQETQKFTIVELIIPALGYLFVGLICIMSGNSLRKEELNLVTFVSISPEQFLYWLLLVPVFINRVTMYEQKSANSMSHIDLQWRKVSIQLPFYIFIFCIFVFSYLNQSLVSHGYSKYNFEVKKIVPLLFGLLPIYIQTFFSWKKWKQHQGQDHFNFRYYIFFPALSTCIVSFLVGWTDLSENWIISIPSLAITIYFLLSIFDKTSIKNWKLTDWVVISLLVPLFFYQFVIALPFKIHADDSIDFRNGLTIILTCVIMSLIMGITETWWFIKDEENMNKYSSADIQFYQSRLNKFNATLPLFIPVCIFHPQTNNNFYLILIYAIILCVIWFYFQRIKNKFWRWIRFVFGIILPILISLSLRDINGVVSPINNKTALNTLAFVAIFIGVASLYRGRDRKNKIFSDISKDKQIAIFTSIGFLAIFCFIPNVLNVSMDKKLIEKINLLIIFYTIILVIFFIEIILKLLKYDNEDKAGNQNDESSDSRSNELKNLLLFFYSGRPTTSLLAFFLTYLILFSHNYDLIISIIKALPIFIVTMLGFVFNDIYDKNKDAMAGKKRPISTGILKTSKALNYSIVFSSLLFIYNILFNNLNSTFIIGITLFLVILYSPFSKRQPVLKCFYTALLCCTPVLFGYSITNSEIEFSKMIPLLLFIIGREIWLDRIDMDGDLKSNLRTIPHYLGSSRSMILAFFLMTVSSTAVWILSNGVFNSVISLLSLLSVILCYIVSYKYESISVKITKISMFLGIIALLT